MTDLPATTPITTLPRTQQGERLSYHLERSYEGARTPYVVYSLHALDLGSDEPWKHLDRWCPDVGWVDFAPDLGLWNGMSSRDGSELVEISEHEVARWIAGGLGPWSHDLPYQSRACP